MTPVTLMVLPEVPTVPRLEVVYPAATGIVAWGGVQPEGTTTSTSPLDTPPLAGAYVKVRVLPVEPAVTAPGATVMVPTPAARTFTVGCGGLRAVSAPPPVDFSLVANVLVSAADGALAPGPPPVLSP